MESDLSKFEIGSPVMFEIQNQFTKYGIVVGFTKKMLLIAYLSYTDAIKFAKRTTVNVNIIQSNSTQYKKPIDKIRKALEIEKFNLI